MSADRELVRAHYASHARGSCLAGCFACEDAPKVVTEAALLAAVRAHLRFVQKVRWNPVTQEGTFELWDNRISFERTRAFAAAIGATEVLFEPVKLATEYGGEHGFSVTVSCR